MRRSSISRSVRRRRSSLVSCVARDDARPPAQTGRCDSVSAPIAIVDYGVGNVGSIQNMLKKVGSRSVVVSTPDEILQAKKLILPGVGAFDAGMDALRKSGLVDALRQQALQAKVPV